MRHIYYALDCIQRAMTRVEKDRFTPAVLSPELSDYLNDLALKHPQDGSSFSKFVVLLPHEALEQELLRQVLPEQHRQQILDYRSEHEALQIKKEHACVESNFTYARDCLDQQKQLGRLIQGLIAGQELVVTPRVIDSALKSLGYDEP